MAKQIKINIYKSAGKWYGARWIDGEYDGCDQLDCESSASDEEATETALEFAQLLDGDCSVERVADVSEAL